MNDYQLVLDAEILLERLKIPAIRDSYPVCRLYPAIKRAYYRYVRRYVKSLNQPADAGRSPVSGSSTQSAGMGQGGTCSFSKCTLENPCPDCGPSLIQFAD
jgi:hypothetical protein